MRVIAALAMAVAFCVSPITGRTAVRAAHPHPTAPMHFKVAPADEYFGKLGMSILGIRNEMSQLSAKVDGDAGAGEIQGAETLEDAIRDWAQKYPQDDWLDRYAVGLEQLYARMQVGESRTHLTEFAQWIHKKYAGQKLDTDCADIAASASVLPADGTTPAGSP
jgi:hypothetical protein